MKKYRLTDAHRAAMPAWASRWIMNALSTEGMTEIDRAICREAIADLYVAAHVPQPQHVVFVPSPFVLVFAAGFAAACWYVSQGQATWEATWEATWDATWQATREATRAATWDATWQATREATAQATQAATWEATWEATREASWDATWQATQDATAQATQAATWEATWEATREATWEATREATAQATAQATWQATWEATREATQAATWEATREATWQATAQATWQATWEATREATWQATAQATREATAQATKLAIFCFGGAGGDMIHPLVEWFSAQLSIPARFLGSCISQMHCLWQGGNQWSDYDSWMTFFRYVAALPLDYSRWDAWERLSLHSGPRIVHHHFTMISDRPERLLLDEQSRPHCPDGPFCRWRDGSAIYAVHGVYVPWWIIEHPQWITLETIHSEDNAELRRIMSERYGWDRLIEAEGAVLIDADTEPVGAPGLRGLFQCANGSRLLICCCASSGETYHLEVPPEVETCKQAANWLAQGELKWLLVRT